MKLLSINNWQSLVNMLLIVAKCAYGNHIYGCLHKDWSKENSKKRLKNGTWFNFSVQFEVSIDRCVYNTP